MKRRLLRILFVVVVLFGAVAGATMFVASTDAGAHWVLARVRTATGGNMNWAAADGTLLSGMRLADVAYDDGSSLLRIQRVEFAWQPWRVFDGTLVLDSIDIVGLRHQTRVASNGAPMTEERLRELLFSLPVAIELREFRADDIEVTSLGGTTTRIDLVAGGAALDGSGLELREVEVRQGDARVSGDLQMSDELALSGTVAWQFARDGQQFAGTLDVAGTLRQPELVHELAQPLNVTSRGRLNAGIFAGDALSFDLQHELPLQALAALQQPDLQLQLSARTSGTPEQVAIDGSAHAVVAALVSDPAAPAIAPLDARFALDYRDAALALDSVSITSTQIGVQGSGLLELDPLALRLDWQLVALNAEDFLPQLQLADVTGSGSVQLADEGGTLRGALQLDALAGTLNGYPLSVTGRAGTAAANAATLELNAASGNNAIALAGSIGDELLLDWSIAVPEPGALWQGLSGAVNGSGNISGLRTAPEVNGALNGALQLARDGEVLAVNAIALNAEYGAGGNDLQLELGRITRAADGETSVLLERAELALTGTPEQHSLNAMIASSADTLELALQGAFADGDWRGTIVDAGIDSRAGDWQLDAPAQLAYVGGGLTLSEQCWSYLQTRLCLQGGKPVAQGFDADVTLSALPLDWLNPPASAPATKPAALQQAQDDFSINLPRGVRMEGLLDARATLRNLNGSDFTSFELALQPRGWAVEVTQQIDDGADPEAPPLIQRFGLDTNLAEVSGGANGWEGSLDMRIRHIIDGNSGAQGTLRGSAALAADGSLSGSADFAFAELGWIEFITPVLRSPAGALNGTIGVSGTQQRPLLQANMQLRDGSFDVPLYGLAIRDLAIVLNTDATNALRLEASARSGNGVLQLDAEVSNPLQPDRAVSARVNGSDVQALATDYATVTLSPMLSASFANEVLTVNGSIEVKDTEVNLEEVVGAGGENAVGVSRDVVIVSGEQDFAGMQQDALRIAADVDLRIGQDVRVGGYGLDATLDGELRIEQTPGRPALVYGELGIPEGRYEIYNQELNARDGRLLFFGNPANPLLDVRAFRDIDSGEVGVHLTGNLDSIQGRLYSTPTLPDNEALALLVTGKSFNSVNAEESDALVGAIASFGLGRGEGFTERVGSTLGLDSFTVGGGSTLEDSALGLGKYLTPDLLMRYKLGLFDRQSVLGIEYTLTERLKLEVETGISQSVDLNYTIEKD